MLVTLLGIVTLVKLLQLENAQAPMLVTEYPFISLGIFTTVALLAQSVMQTSPFSIVYDNSPYVPEVVAAFISNCDTIISNTTAMTPMSNFLLCFIIPLILSFSFT